MTRLAPEHTLLQALIRCPSVTPKEGGALELLQETLSQGGFACHRLAFGEGAGRVDNLFAIYDGSGGGGEGHDGSGGESTGGGGPHLGFAGHTDVVPPGEATAWRHDPFGGIIEGGVLYGRGAVDMKGGIAAFVAAALGHIKNHGIKGRISLMITGDEEGEAVNGTKPMLDWIEARGLMPDAVLLGEPTNPRAMGEMIKHGRRGSLSGEITVEGRQGHVAYPDLACNPLPLLMAMLAPLAEGEIDDGNEHFSPSTAAITAIDTGNPARNVIPQKARAAFNIRYNSGHTAESLKAWLGAHFNSITEDWQAEWIDNAHPFITPPGGLTRLMTGAIEDITGITPQLSTSGGTSDARFIARHTEVVEFGLVGQTMHQINEATPLEDVTILRRIYARAIERFFADDGADDGADDSTAQEAEDAAHTEARRP